MTISQLLGSTSTVRALAEMLRRAGRLPPQDAFKQQLLLVVEAYSQQAPEFVVRPVFVAPPLRCLRAPLRVMVVTVHGHRPVQRHTIMGDR
jgi:hypothetical protein